MHRHKERGLFTFKHASLGCPYGTGKWKSHSHSSSFYRASCRATSLEENVITCDNAHRRQPSAGRNRQGWRGHSAPQTLSCEAGDTDTAQLSLPEGIQDNNHT